jgi:hypothetical protein
MSSSTKQSKKPKPGSARPSQPALRSKSTSFVFAQSTADAVLVTVIVMSIRVRRHVRRTAVDSEVASPTGEHQRLGN